MLTLVMGNRNYSSWSLRGWLYLRESGIEFDEIVIPMFTSTWHRDIAAYTPAGRVPVLLDGDQTIWDTAAIFEYLLEQYPNAVGWPKQRAARARARSVTAEMHAGFLAVREELPQNIRLRAARDPADLSEGCRQQISRIENIWSAATGPWLFGGFSIADVMFAPVALRFATYCIELAPKARQFVDNICALSSVQEWTALCEQEAQRIAFIDDLAPLTGSPLTLG